MRLAWAVAFSKSVLVGAATGAGVEAEEIAETKLHRIQGSALRWPLSWCTHAKIMVGKMVGNIFIVRLNIDITMF